MFAQFIFSISFLSIFYLGLFTRYSISFKSFAIIFFLLLAFSSNTYLWFKEKKPAFLLYISSCRFDRIPFFIGISFVFLFLSFYFLLPSRGLTISFAKEENKPYLSTTLDLDHFRISPSLFSYDFLSEYFSEVQITGTFYLEKPIRAISFYSNHGDIDWFIDHILLKTNKNDDVTRFSTVKIDLSPGFHEISCIVKESHPIPNLSVSVSDNIEQQYEYLPGPFLGNSSFFDIRFIHNLYTIKYLSVFLGLILLIPLFNNIINYINTFFNRFYSILFPISFLFLLLLLVSFYIFIYNLSFCQYEADEAAFGLMGEELLLGQSPPLFHYGQSYQGTSEVFPLSFLFSYFDFPSALLHFLPLLFGVVFSLVTIFTFYCFGSKETAFFVFLFLCFSGLHFYWIVSKCWFGYSFSLAIGSILFFILFFLFWKNRCGIFPSFLLGCLSALSFYELPLSFPFVFATYLFFLFLLYNSKQKHSQLRPFSNFISFVFLHRSHLVFLSGFVLFSFPYWFLIWTSFDSSFLQFLFTGRNLPSPRLLDEHPFFNRFLDECLPTFFGIRPPYDQLHDIPSALFSSTVPILYIFSILLFPLLSSRFLPSNTILSRRTIRYFIFLFICSSIFIGVYSPFGIWPWYFLPLYWSFPLILYVLFSWLWSLSPALSFGLILSFLVSIASTFSFLSPLYFQPSSLSSAGLILPTDFDKIKYSLNYHNVRYVLCDQGFDYSQNIDGKDWIGECLMFDSKLDVIATDRILRRLPSCSQEVMRSNRVAYLFHNDYHYNNPKTNDTNYIPISLSHFDRLLNQELEYKKISFDRYTLYIPDSESISIRKDQWNVSSSNPLYLNASKDHNISVRLFGPEGYWSSDQIPEAGILFSIHFQSPSFFRKIVLFHGTKKYDYPYKNTVYAITEEEKKAIGSLQYDPDARSSSLSLENQILSDEIVIEVFPPDGDFWLTIFEVWIF